MRPWLYRRILYRGIRHHLDKCAVTSITLYYQYIDVIMIVHESKFCKYVLYNDNVENQFFSYKYLSVMHTTGRHRQSSSSCAYIVISVACRGKLNVIAEGLEKKVDSSKWFFFLQVYVCVCVCVRMYACNSDRINYIMYGYDAVSQFGWPRVFRDFDLDRRYFSFFLFDNYRICSCTVLLYGHIYSFSKIIIDHDELFWLKNY